MNEQLKPQTYQSVFSVHPAGQKVLEELSARFYDIASYTKNDSHETAFKEGQRSVLRFIIGKLGQIEAGEQE
jgi:hypothetical protein